MSYEFERPNRLAFEIRRVAAERLDDALEQLAGGLAADPAAAVHTARKDLKKTRSLMRLAKDSIGPDRFQVANDRLRDAAHLLAGAREADALSESLEALLAHAGASMSPEALESARAWLTGMPGGQDAGPDITFAASKASVLIAAGRDDARTWALGYGSFELIEQGIRRAYRQGRRYLAAATDDPTDETLHEWRKRAKDMWYSLRLMGTVWEPVMRPLADRAHDLTDILGDHHDLGQVRIAIESGESGLSAGPRAELSALAQARQTELHGAAISLGRRLYAERPRRYVERLEGLWKAWEADASQHVGQEGLRGL